MQILADTETWQPWITLRQKDLTNLEIAAETISLEISIFVLIEFDFVLISDGIPHHNATLWHQFSKLFSADVRGQTWGKERKRRQRIARLSYLLDFHCVFDNEKKMLAIPTWHIDVCVFVVVNFKPSYMHKKGKKEIKRCACTNLNLKLYIQIYTVNKQSLLQREEKVETYPN